jgi:outer membrane protein assembly factor BamD
MYSTPQKNYDAGKKALKGGNWLEAIQYFQYIRATFGFSKWATLAELGLADADLGREKYIEAADAYRLFKRSHPNHEHVLDGYVGFKVAEAFFKQVPSDFFILPPSYEKDQGPVIDSLRELRAFIQQSSDSAYTPEAKKYLDTCIKRLTDHEFYVAEYYLKRNKPLAAVGRLEGVLKDFPDSNREPETLLLLGRTYVRVDDKPHARELFARLVEKFPSDKRADQARQWLEFLDGKRSKAP